MILKSVARRLKRLEESSPAAAEPKFWQVVTIGSDRNLEHGPGYSFRPIPNSGFRPALGSRKSRRR